MGEFIQMGLFLEETCFQIAIQMGIFQAAIVSDGQILFRWLFKYRCLSYPTAQQCLPTYNPAVDHDSFAKISPNVHHLPRIHPMLAENIRFNGQFSTLSSSTPCND
jgi:hypothetical protein